MGEAFGEPQLSRGVGALEIERLQPHRPDPLGIPAVEELVRHGIGDVAPPVVGQRDGRGDDGAVAVLHPVAVGVRQTVDEKRVMARFVFRIAPVDGAFLPDNPLGIVRERVELVVGPGMMQRQPERPPIDRKHAHPDRAELRGTVHQVFEVGGGEFQRLRAGMQLRGHAPGLARRLRERHDDRSILEPPRPHDCRRHVDVCVRLVDREVRAIQPIAVHLVCDGNGAAVLRHIPAVRVGPRRGELATAGKRPDVVHIFREVVQRVVRTR